MLGGEDRIRIGAGNFAHHDPADSADHRAGEERRRRPGNETEETKN